MDLNNLLINFAKQGIQIEVFNNRLKVQTSNHSIPSDIKELLEDFEKEIILWLNNRTDTLVQITPNADNRYKPFPLTDIQHAYWVGRSDVFDLGDVGTHIYLELACPALDGTQLNEAWQQLINHHDMLRAIVTSDGRQQVLKQVPAYKIKGIDLRGQSENEIDAHIVAVRQRLEAQVLPAEQWPLFEIETTELYNQQGLSETRLHISLDVLFCDLSSLFQLFSQWQMLYEDSNAALPSTTLHFSDYVLAEKHIETTSQFVVARNYWMERLKTIPPAPELPLAQNASTLKKTGFQRRSARLDKTTWDTLKAQANSHGLTPNALLLAVFSEVLMRWSKNPAFTLNLTLFNRQPFHPDVNQLIGDFTAITLFSVDNSKAAPFVQRAKNLQQQLWRDLEQRAFDGVRVIRELARQNGKTGEAIMPIVFTSGLGLEAGPGFQPFGKEVYSCSQTPQVWLDHIVLEEDGELSFSWNSVDALFSTDVMDDMFNAYCHFLKALAETSTLWNEQHPVPIPQIQQQLLQMYNATQTSSSEKLLHTLFLQQLEMYSNNTAIISPTCTFSYRTLYEYANTVGHILCAEHVKPNTLVAIIMEKGWEQIVAALGIHFAGAAYLPIDPNLPIERQNYMLMQSDVTIVLTQRQQDKKLTGLQNIQYFFIDELVVDSSLSVLKTVQKITDIAYIIYTSGSTGLPKGVVIDHQGAVNTILDINRRFNVTADDKILAISALNFDLSVYDFFGLLAVGGTIVFPSSDLRTDPAHWYELMVRYQVTLWNTVPALMQMLVDYFDQNNDSSIETHEVSTIFAPSFLRLVMMSGDWIPTTLPQRINALWEKTEIYSLGGATEASIWSIYYHIKKINQQWSSIPYGRPMDNQHFYVLDKHLQPCPIWVPGELYIGGVGLAIGYWKDEEKTDKHFIIHPISGERLYKTGDLGCYLSPTEDADELLNIEFLGREDFQVKIRGHRIELGEIETLLLQHKSLREVVVNAIGDPKGSRQLIAYVVAEEQHKHDLFIEKNIEGIEHIYVNWDYFLNTTKQHLEQRPQEREIEAYIAEWDSLNELYLNAIYYAFNRLGIYQLEGESHSVNELMATHAISSRYQKWLQRALNVLVEEDWLQVSKNNFLCVRSLPIIELSNIETFTAVRVGHASISFLREAALKLVDVLQENIHSAELYANEKQITEVYKDGFDRINQLLCEIMPTLIEQYEGEINILEVGAGYGSTTNYLLPLLPLERTHYTFTDVSDFFLQRAEKAFNDSSVFSFSHLNLEQNPVAQGYIAHSYDFIIASSVLHVPRCIEETLQHLYSLLAPNGLLVIIEETKFHPSYDLGMGLQQGFERFEDHSLRPSHPLLSRTEWIQALQKTGFVESSCFNQKGSITDVLGIDIIVAQGNATVQQFNESSLLNYLAKKLPEYMVPSHIILLDALPLSANGKVDRQALPTLQSRLIQAKNITLAETSTQINITKIWSEILKIDTIGIDENFFSLGGDSLLATQVVSKLRTIFAIDFQLSRLFQHPTIAKLAIYIEPLVSIEISGLSDEEGEIEQW